MVESAFRHAHLDQDSQDWVRGIWGLPPAAPITLEGLKEAILASDLFSAPWMVAVWTPDNQWVVEGIAGTYLRKEADASNPIFTDLLTLRRGDQVAKLDKYGDVVPGTGPSLGIQTVISGVDLALRLGYSLDLLPTPFHAPVDSWEDGVPGFGESPLMGVALLSKGRRWLLRFRRDHDQWWAEGLKPEDLPTIRNLIGFDASIPLDVIDIEWLLAKGNPIWARIPSLLRVWG